MAAFFLIRAAGGCAYELHSESRVADPGRLARLRKVAVAPFRYPHDWTGYFRDIYRSAGLTPPPAKKIEEVESSFLPEGALLKRGYTVPAWPGKMRGFRWGGEGKKIPGAKVLGNNLGEALAAARAAGAGAVLLLKGRSRCPDMNRCVSEVEMRLVDSGTGALIWTSRATGASLIGQGNEMRAAVEKALEALPPPAGR
ncbi:MAG: DUF4136 domain-containing protein [bacterium]